MINARPRNTAFFLTWLALSWLPRGLLAPVVKRRPRVYGFAAGRESRLAAEVAAVNLLTPTRFCRIMTWHGSDKGRSWHNYTAVYAQLLADRLGQPLRIFELGLGTNNPTLVSSMGATGRPGASLRGWAELFPNAAVFGADIDRTILFQEANIRTFYCDQLDAGAIATLWREPALAEGVDLLIEDGLHTLEANRSFLAGSLDKVRPGGFYVIEDIGTDTLPEWRRLLAEEYAPAHPGFDFVLAELPNPANAQDNNILLARRDY